MSVKGGTRGDPLRDGGSAELARSPTSYTAGRWFVDAVTPWPGLVKRLRFLSSLKQDELAHQLGVDQSTVSRWERGTHDPDIPVQKRLRDMLHRLEPAIGPAAVEAMPMLAILYDSDHMGLCCAASQPFADLYRGRADQLRSQMIKDDWSESLRNMFDAFMASDAWKSNDVAFGVATLLRPDSIAVVGEAVATAQRWAQFTFMPLGGAPLLLGTGVAIPPPNDLNPHEFKLTITTKDELCE